MRLHRTFTVADVEQVLSEPCSIEGSRSVTFSTVEALFEAGPGSLTWMRPDLAGKDGILRKTSAAIVICDLETTLPPDANLCLVRVSKPQIAFMRVLNDLVAPRERKSGVHPTAIVHPDARMGREVYIGPFAIIGRCEIGDESVIESHTVIADDVTIGRRTLIREHCSVGGQGFGHVANERGQMENMSHIGRVMIGDDVDLFPYVNVDRATLGTTVVANGAKIDHFCHIGHNSAIGESAVITAGVTICGGARVGAFAWIGVHSVIRDSITVGDHAFVGMGSMVTKNVPAGAKWVGSPARPLDEYRTLQDRLRDLCDSRGAARD